MAKEKKPWILPQKSNLNVNSKQMLCADREGEEHNGHREPSPPSKRCPWDASSSDEVKEDNSEYCNVSEEGRLILCEQDNSEERAHPQVPPQIRDGLQ